ncbi:unnamed protein product [Urochloa humidicola]
MPMNGRSGSEAGDMVRGAGAGLGGLRKEVSTCEYHDVHVMWEMLSVTSSSSNTNAGKEASKRMEKKKKEKRGSLPVAYWTRLLKLVAKHSCSSFLNILRRKVQRGVV